MPADEQMTAAQAATLKRLAQDAYELDAFKPNLSRTAADKRIAMLTAKLKLLASRRIHSETNAAPSLPKPEQRAKLPRFSTQGMPRPAAIMASRWLTQCHARS